jgi:hypothetical protein
MKGKQIRSAIENTSRRVDTGRDNFFYTFMQNENKTPAVQEPTSPSIRKYTCAWADPELTRGGTYCEPHYYEEHVVTDINLHNPYYPGKVELGFDTIDHLVCKRSVDVEVGDTILCCHAGSSVWFVAVVFQVRRPWDDGEEN